MINRLIVSDKNIEFKISETKEEIIIDAQVPKRVIVSDPKVRCSTKDVTDILKDNSIGNLEILKLTESPRLALTNSRDENMNGRWIFEKPKTRNPRKNQKSIRARTKAIASKRKEVQIEG